MRTADELISSIVNSSRIPSGRRHDIQRELRCHIEDFVVAAREAGRDQDEIEQLVLANFGDPRQIAQSFAWVYRHERRRLRAFTYTLSTVLLAGSLLAAILVMQAGLAFSFGTSVMATIASQHTKIEALDILTSVAAYLALTLFEGIFETHGFRKASFLLTTILTILIVLSATAGWRTSFLVYGLINGVFCRAVQLFVTPKVARAGIFVVCFVLAGLGFALLRSPVSQAAVLRTCFSWFMMGAGYQLMTVLAPRLDAALLTGLQRIQTGP